MTADEDLATKFRNVAETGDGMVSVHLLSEAADALDRLTAELQGVKDSRDMVIEECEDDLREARAEIAKLREALDWLLPMAKGYAHEHDVGGNAAKVIHAEEVIAALASHTEPHTKETT